MKTRSIKLIFDEEDWKIIDRARRRTGLKWVEIFRKGVEAHRQEQARIESIESLGGYIDCFCIWRQETGKVRSKIRMYEGKSTAPYFRKL